MNVRQNVTVGLAATVLVLASAGRAFACGMAAEPYRTIAEVSPADNSEGFPRNGAVRIRLATWPDQEATGMLSVRVTRVDGGAVVKGQLQDWLNGDYVWAPDAPLPANTEFRLEVATTEKPLAAIDAPTRSSTTFKTSDAMAPEMTLDGDLRVMLRLGTAPKYDYSRGNDCGGAPIVGERPALIAEIDLPRVSGGIEAFGYHGWVTLSDDAPVMFDGPGEGTASTAGNNVDVGQFLTLAGGEAMHIQIEVPREDQPYAACFAFNAWDAAGQSQSAAPVCVSRRDVEAAFATLEASDAGMPDGGAASHSDAGEVVDGPDAGMPVAHEGTPDAGHTPDRQRKRDGAGCAVAVRGARTNLWSMAAVVLGGIALRLRRRARG